MDLKSGSTLWQGSAQATSAEAQQQQQGGLAGLLISAIIKQVMASTFDETHKYSGVSTERLLTPNVPQKCLLYGPRSPNFGKD
jgi:hypothetical protein